MKLGQCKSRKGREALRIHTNQLFSMIPRLREGSFPALTITRRLAARCTISSIHFKFKLSSCEIKAGSGPADAITSLLSRLRHPHLRLLQQSN